MQVIPYIVLIFAMVVPTMSFCTITTTTRYLVGRHIRRRHHITNASSRRHTTKYTAIYSSQRIMPLERPQDPTTFTDDDVHNQAQTLREWMRGKKSVLCISGAGMSTESNIPDYRGSNGSYHRGHKPIIHHEFMNSQSMRQRYWSRSLVGYSAFSNAKPNKGHRALAWLESENCIGVNLGKECTAYDQLSQSCFGSNVTDEKRLSVITQNVDSLHSAGGLKYCMHLHGRGDLVECQNCGCTQDRMEYHKQLAQHNEEWLAKATAKSKSINQTKDQRPDGDVEIDVSSEELFLPSCPSCGEHHTKTDGVHNPSFFKTSVVFFGGKVLNSCDVCFYLFTDTDSTYDHSLSRFCTKASI